MALKSFIHIEAALKNGRTILQKGQADRPFKVADITEGVHDQTLRLMMMSSSPGLLDGDHAVFTIRVQAGCRLELQTQSFQRLFTMSAGASQEIHLEMQAGSSFKYLPHPVVPHRQSDVSARNTIRLENDCELLWGEVLTCGRKLNGEVFTLTRYHAITEIFICGRLVIRENLLLQPALFSSRGIGQLEGYTHQATLVYLHESAPVKGLLQAARLLISSFHGVTGGATSSPVNGVVVRLLGHQAELLHGCLQSLGALLADLTCEHVLTVQSSNSCNQS